MADHDPIAALTEFPLLDAVFGRRSRRFGAGMQIPDGPLAHTSNQPALPLDDREIAVLTAMACGSIGWHEGIPHRDGDAGLASYAFRFTGRASPGGAGIGTGELIYTNDSGTYIVRTRDIKPIDAELTGVARIEALTRQVADNTERLSASRVQIPRAAPHMHEHNFWNTNVEGSTLFLPIVDLAQKLLGIMAAMIQNGTTFVDEKTGTTCGELEPFIKSGLLDPARKAPIAQVEASVVSTGSMENAIMAQNIVLGLQALGLGGWLFTGINPVSLMGGYADQGVAGLGFRFTRDERWLSPNPVGLDHIFESWCPPYVVDMHSAARKVAETKFGEHGVYTPSGLGGYTPRIRASATAYSQEFVECLGTVAQYVFDTSGKFPGNHPAVLMTPYVQAHHIDLDWYDKYLGKHSHLTTHKDHIDNWHDSQPENGRS